MDSTTSLIVSPVLYWKAGALVALAAGAVEAHRMRLSGWTMYLAALAGFGGALFVSWLYVALFAHSSAEIGGRAAIGAFIGAAACGWLVLRLRGGDFLRYADAAVPGVALGYVVYRIGCLLNGGCFGVPTDLPWAISFGPGTEAFAFHVAHGLIAADAARTLPVHPTQLYHAALGLVSFLVMLRIRLDPPGRRLAVAMIMYGAGRFAIEFLRADAQPVLGPLDMNQIFCLGMLATGLLLWRSLRRAYAAAPLLNQGA